MGHGARKPVYGVCEHVRIKSACSATETSKNNESFYKSSLDIILCRECPSSLDIILKL